MQTMDPILSTKQILMDKREQPSFNLDLDFLPISQLIDSQKKSTGVIEIMIESNALTIMEKTVEPL